MTTEAPEHDQQDAPFDPESERRRRGRLELLLGSSVLVGVLVLVSLIWLFGPGDDDPKAPADVKSLPYADGTLVVVEDRALTMEPFKPVDGRSEIEFTIREQDAQYFDIAHLKSHSSIALPTRIYYEKSGGQYFARYKEDAPANSQTGS